MKFCKMILAYSFFIVNVSGVYAYSQVPMAQIRNYQRTLEFTEMLKLLSSSTVGSTKDFDPSLALSQCNLLEEQLKIGRLKFDGWLQNIERKFEKKFSPQGEKEVLDYFRLPLPKQKGVSFVDYFESERQKMWNQKLQLQSCGSGDAHDRLKAFEDEVDAFEKDSLSVCVRVTKVYRKAGVNCAP